MEPSGRTHVGSPRRLAVSGSGQVTRIEFSDDARRQSQAQPRDARARLVRVMANTVQATRLRKGNLVKHNNELFRIIETQHVTPGNLRGFVRAKMRNVRNSSLLDHRFRSEDMVERAILDEREMQYLYKDGDGYCFMDTSSYEQIHLSEEALGDSMSYLLPEATIQVEFYEGVPVGIELPQTVDLKVVEERSVGPAQ